jgi:hypothetical protein
MAKALPVPHNRFATPFARAGARPHGEHVDVLHQVRTPLKPGADSPILRTVCPAGRLSTQPLQTAGGEPEATRLGPTECGPEMMQPSPGRRFRAITRSASTETDTLVL